MTKLNFLVDDFSATAKDRKINLSFEVESSELNQLIEQIPLHVILDVRFSELLVEMSNELKKNNENENT